MPRLIRFVFTVVVLAAAVLAGIWLWRYYMYTPWTRDARVRADIVTITPDVSGWVEDFNANDKRLVHKGDLLFTVDLTRYQLALDQAQASAEKAHVAWALAEHSAVRRAQLGQLTISQEARDTANLGAAEAKAAYDVAQVAVNSAQLDVTRARYVAPFDGQLVNLQLHPGDYVTRGSAKISLIRDGSYYLTGYFEETKLAGIQVGDPVDIHLMASNHSVKGHVTAIGRGISNSNLTPGSDLLPSVAQTFTWVRLAQRIPVDVAFDEPPTDVMLSAGMTATLLVHPEQSAPPAPVAPTPVAPIAPHSTAAPDQAPPSNTASDTPATL